MRFYVESKIGPARRAKQLKKTLEAVGYDMKLSQCQRLVAQMMGFRDWGEMYHHIGLSEPSLGDAQVDEHERERRRKQHVGILREEGIEKEDAETAVDIIGPTDYGAPRADDSDEERDFVKEWGLTDSSRR
ncbi:hypothetical protein [Aurantimonas endophytica]|uniref:Uncharacterized protein n=1 Tax=Aurantimonas endophytica TaxID=1522175 RepID=A0A7W6MMY1_9HYPH|nr:hypothetical protein [Aurantimonas endophytica]MBB4001264.1 hypothetical protein [Aurantimonas endophytica]MCO6403091.1 hypothetical protein [Aurantimonas endophytica]